MIESAQLVGRVMLAAPLLLAAVMTMLDFRGSARGMQTFGVPPHFATLVTLLLGLGELTLGAAIVPVPAAWWQAPIWLALLGGVMLGLVLGAFGVMGFIARPIAKARPVVQLIREAKPSVRRAA
jgi:uncharacterized membrane protein YphA (DoxX/SURF4 family)